MSLILGAAVHAAPRAAAPPHPPAEELRLNTFQFREWLRKQGLTEVLELHLKDFPPSDPTVAALTEREFKLAEFRDAQRLTQERQAAIRDANDILARLAIEFPEDPRALQWRYALAYSLIYDQGEPSATAILYFGGGPDDRRTLSECAQRSLEVTRALADRIARENARIDRLSSAEFEEVERRGLIEQLDRLGPSTDYLMLWVLFYDALARDESDPRRAALLQEVGETFIRRPELLQTPQEKSGVQAPALLLAGMTARALGHADLAKDYLERAATTWERIPAGEQKDRLRWMSSLAVIERIRAERDAGRFDRALIEVDRLRATTSASGDDAFGLRLAAALVEKSIHLAQAAVADKEGQAAKASKTREEAWGTLKAFLWENYSQRHRLYATVYKALPADIPFNEAYPFERCAIIGALELRRSECEAGADSLDEEIVRLTGEGLSLLQGAAEQLRPELLLQLGRAQLRLGDQAGAIASFIEVGTAGDSFPPALDTAKQAVTMSASLVGSNTVAANGATLKLYRNAIEAILTHYPKTEEARYWVFFHAQLLEQFGEFDSAASAYLKVDKEHQYYCQSAFLRVRALSSELARLDPNEPDDQVYGGRLTQLESATGLLHERIQGQLWETCRVPLNLVVQRLVIATCLEIATATRDAVGFLLTVDSRIKWVRFRDWVGNLFQLLPSKHAEKSNRPKKALQKTGWPVPRFATALIDALRTHFHYVAVPQTMGTYAHIIRTFQETSARLAAAPKTREHYALLAEATVLLAEAFGHSGSKDNQRCIELLAGFEWRFPDAGVLAPRVTRARLLALVALNRVDEASALVDSCIAMGGDALGATLQSACDLLTRDAPSWNAERKSSPRENRAGLALKLTKGIEDWTKTHDPASIGKDARSVRAQLAEAYLRAAQPEAAQKLFDELAAGAGSEGSGITATLGRAEAQFQQEQFAEALPAFAKLATTLPAESPKRWKALLRDLQCRTRLGQPAQGVLKVLSQQKFLYPQMGGQEFAEHFETLRLENEKRPDAETP